MKDSCRSANLSALLHEDRLPDLLKPYLGSLKNLLYPKPFVPKTTKHFDDVFQPLSSQLHADLVDRLNTEHAEDHLWIASDDWCDLSEEDSKRYSPVASQATFHGRIQHHGVSFATFTENPNNSVVHVKLARSGTVLFGRITSLFTHQRKTSLGIGCPKIDTWASVQYFSPVPPRHYNPFSEFSQSQSAMQVHLRLYDPGLPQLIRLEEIVCHCAWLVYEPCEIHEELNLSSIALVSLDR